MKSSSSYAFVRGELKLADKGTRSYSPIDN